MFNTTTQIPPEVTGSTSSSSTSGNERANSIPICLSSNDCPSPKMCFDGLKKKCVKMF